MCKVANKILIKLMKYHLAQKFKRLGKSEFIHLTIFLTIPSCVGLESPLISGVQHMEIFNFLK